MIFACGIWCLADVSSVSHSSTLPSFGVCSDEGLTLETSAIRHIRQAKNKPYQPLLIKPIFSVLSHTEKTVFSKLVFQCLVTLILPVLISDFSKFYQFSTCINISILLIQKRLSSELLHCALRIVAYRTAEHHAGCNEFVHCCMPRPQSIVFHIASMANTRKSLSHSRYLQCCLKFRYIHGATWVCNNTQCTM